MSLWGAVKSGFRKLRKKVVSGGKAVSRFVSKPFKSRKIRTTYHKTLKYKPQPVGKKELTKSSKKLRKSKGLSWYQKADIQVGGWLPWGVSRKTAKTEKLRERTAQQKSLTQAQEAQAQADKEARQQEYDAKLQEIMQKYQYKIDVGDAKVQAEIELQRQREAEDLAKKSWYETMGIKYSPEERSYQDMLRRQQYYEMSVPEAQRLIIAHEEFKPLEKPAQAALIQTIPQSPQKFNWLPIIIIGAVAVGGYALLK